MTKSDLFTWRKRAPVFIFGVCLLPWVVLNAKNLDEAKLLSELLLPIIAVIAGFFYVGLDFSRSRWKSEQEAHVGKQIREALIDMVPKDLGVTESEKKALSEREVYKDLTGVFWEAVDGNESLRSLKEHFFANGIVYSVSIDVYLICGFYACFIPSSCESKCWIQKQRRASRRLADRVDTPRVKRFSSVHQVISSR
jgi:hypothetical protein